MSLVQLVFGRLWRFLNTLENDDFYLQSIAVAPECRGEGVGSMLIDAMEKRASSTAATRFVLDVAAKNDGARRLYERRGMTVQARWPSRVPLPKYHVLRMAKPLR
jgi:ribosomal protein S18 acetylase RimI-like enzyme